MIFNKVIISLLVVCVVLMCLELPIKMLQAKTSDYISLYRDGLFAIIFLSAIVKISYCGKIYGNMALFIPLVAFLHVVILAFLGEISTFDKAFLVRTTAFFPFVIAIALATLDDKNLTVLKNRLVKIIKVFVLLNFFFQLFQLYLGPNYLEILGIPAGDLLVRDASVPGVVRPVGLFRSSELLAYFGLLAFAILLFFNVRGGFVLKLVALLIVFLSTSKTVIVLATILCGWILLSRYDRVTKFLALMLMAFPLYFIFGYKELIVSAFSVVSHFVADKQLISFLVASTLDRFSGWATFKLDFWACSIFDQIVGPSRFSTIDNFYFFCLNHFGWLGLLGVVLSVIILLVKSNLERPVMFVTLVLLISGMFLDVIQNVVVQVMGTFLLIFGYRLRTNLGRNKNTGVSPVG